MSPRLYYHLSIFVIAVSMLTVHGSADAARMWAGRDGSLHSSAHAACAASKLSTSEGTLTTKVRVDGYYIDAVCSWSHGTGSAYLIFPTGTCDAGQTSVTPSTESSALCSCPAGKELKDNGVCGDPTPPINCPPGSNYSWDTNSCIYPQDDLCGSVGASWSPEKQNCVCPGGKVFTHSGGFSSCMVPVDDKACTAASSDYAGTINGQPICPGRNRCPNGGKPGFIGSGTNMEPICLGGNDPSCPNGTSGVVDGKKVCIPDPHNDPRCGSGFTSGYVGTGENMEHTCVPKDYLPATCPPGQYSYNTGTGMFACVYASNDPVTTPNQDGTPGTPKPSGSGSGTGTTTGKDKDGTVTGSSESDFNFKIEGLFQDQPNVDYKSDMDAFGASELGIIDPAGLAGEFDGSHGAFDDRAKLDTISNFVKTHTIGSSTTCSGVLPFFGYSVSCEKFANYNRIIGWLISLTTMFYIYGVLMRKSESGY